MLEIIFYILTMWIGVILGFLLKSLFIARLHHISGTMVVIKDLEHNKTTYSLILDDPPEVWEYEDTITFKVDTSEESLNRK